MQENEHLLFSRGGAKLLDIKIIIFLVYPQIPDEIKSCEARKHDKEFIPSSRHIKQNKEARKRNGWKRILSAKAAILN